MKPQDILRRVAGRLEGKTASDGLMAYRKNIQRAVLGLRMMERDQVLFTNDLKQSVENMRRLGHSLKRIGDLGDTLLEDDVAALEQLLAASKGRHRGLIQGLYNDMEAVMVVRKSLESLHRRIKEICS